jgi:hypothetical protein
MSVAMKSRATAPRAHLRQQASALSSARFALGGAAIGLTVLLTACGAAPAATASASGRAGLIVGQGDGSFSATCVLFEGSEISGEDLLRRSGIAVTMDVGNPLGTLVCSIDDGGCTFPDEACLCQCRGAGPCSYWAYFNWDADDGWVYAVQGARLRTLRDGDLDAWLWLDRSLPGDQIPLPPPDLTFDSICS